MTNATRVTEEFPGEGKGVLEILPNPWDESKAMLLVEGSDEWGVKAGSGCLPKKNLHGNKMMVRQPFSLNNLEKAKLNLIIEGWGHKLMVNGTINRTNVDHWILHASVEKYNFSEKYYSGEIYLNVTQEVMYDIVYGIEISRVKVPEIYIVSRDYVEKITLILNFPKVEVVISNWHPTNPFDKPWLIEIKNKYNECEESYYSNCTSLIDAIEKIRNGILREVEWDE